MRVEDPLKARREEWRFLHGVKDATHRDGQKTKPCKVLAKPVLRGDQKVLSSLGVFTRSRKFQVWGLGSDLLSPGSELKVDNILWQIQAISERYEAGEVFRHDLLVTYADRI